MIQRDWENDPLRILWVSLTLYPFAGYGRITIDLGHALEQSGIKMISRSDFGWDFRIVPCTPQSWLVGQKDDSRIVEDLIIHTMYDANLLPEQWVWILNKSGIIWVPSQWCKEIFIKSGIVRPIIVSGYGINFEDEEPRYRYIERNLDHKFTFMAMGRSLIDRKGILTVINAFNKLDLDAKLIIKVASGPWKNIKTNKDVELIHAELSTDELESLYARTDCLVYPSNGEGFGLIPLEAMATGCGVIVTDYSGMKEYIRDDVCLPLKIKGEKEATLYNKFFESEAQWADIDFDHLCYLMKWSFDNREKILALGQHASEYVAQEWTWEKAGLRARKALEEVSNGYFS